VNFFALEYPVLPTSEP